MHIEKFKRFWDQHQRQQKLVIVIQDRIKALEYLCEIPHCNKLGNYGSHKSLKLKTKGNRNYSVDFLCDEHHKKRFLFPGGLSKSERNKIDYRKRQAAHWPPGGCLPPSFRESTNGKQEQPRRHSRTRRADSKRSKGYYPEFPEL